MRVFHVDVQGQRYERRLTDEEKALIENLDMAEDSNVMKAHLALNKFAEERGRPRIKGMDFNSEKSPGKRQQKILCGVAEEVIAEIKELQKSGWQLLTETVRTFSAPSKKSYNWGSVYDDGRTPITHEMDVHVSNMQAIMERQAYYWEQ